MKLKSNFILSLFLILSVLAFSPNSAEAKKPDPENTKSEINGICPVSYTHLTLPTKRIV